MGPGSWSFPQFFSWSKSSLARRRRGRVPLARKGKGLIEAKELRQGMALSLSNAGGLANTPGVGAMGIPGASAMGMPNSMPKPQGFPGGAAPGGRVEKAPGGSALEHGLLDGNIGVPDRSCLAVELDGDAFVAAFVDSKGATCKILNDNKDGAVMREAISIPPERSGLVVKYFDRQTSSERGKALPTGILVGGAAIKDDSVVTGAIKRLLGRAAKEEGVAMHAQRCNVVIKSRKIHEARRRNSILGYESDDEIDSNDGGFRVYFGSRLSLELKSTMKGGKMHVLPEELLALCFVELRTRTAAVRKKNCDDPIPRAISFIAPACWGDAQRTAAATAASMVGLDVRLISPSLAATAGALVGGASSAILADEIVHDKNSLSIEKGGKGSGRAKCGNAIKTFGETMRETIVPEIVGLAEPIFASNVLVLTAGIDSLEAALVRIQGSPLDEVVESKKEKKEAEDDKEDEKEEDSKEECKKAPIRPATAFDWIQRIEVLAARGKAYECAGLIDIVDCCSGLESDDVTRLRDFAYKATESYVSSGPSQISKTKGPIRGLQGGVESIMKSLLQLVDSALAAAAAKSATGAMDGISAVLIRGAMLGLPQTLFQQPLKAALSSRCSGSTPTGLWVLSHDVAVRGAAAIAAAKGKLEESIFSHELVATDSLQRAVALAHCKPTTTKTAEESASGLPEWSWTMDKSAEGSAKLDQIFSRDCPLPSVVRRKYDNDSLRKLGLGGLLGPGLNVTVTEQNPDNESEFWRALPIGNPMERGSLKDGTLQRGARVILEFHANESGVVNVETLKFVTGKEDQEERAKESSFIVRNSGRIMMVVFLILFAGSMGWMVVSDMLEQSRLDAKRFEARKAALVEFYGTHNPAKIDSIDDTLRAHYGQEAKLWRKLEKRYGTRPPRPNFLKHGVSGVKKKRKSDGDL